MEPITPAAEDKQTTSDDVTKQERVKEDDAAKRAIRRASISKVRAGIAKRERAMSGQGKEGADAVEGQEDAKAETLEELQDSKEAVLENEKEEANST